MTQNPSAADWVATRGDQWCEQLQSMEAMLHPVDEPLLHALALDSASRIAEIGCGGGGTARHISRKAKQGSVVHGFDISPRLVEKAREHAQAHGCGACFHVANMQHAEPEEPYDRLASRFGIMFFDEPKAAFGNLLHWLEPGGRFAFAAWSHPAENPWISTVRDVVAQFVEIPRPDPDAPGPFRYADAQKLLALLEQAGFSEVSVHDWRGSLPIGGGLPPSEAADFALAAFSAFGEILNKAGKEKRDEAHRALTTRYERHLKEGHVHFDACVHLFTGKRP